MMPLPTTNTATAVYLFTSKGGWIDVDFIFDGEIFRLQSTGSIHRQHTIRRQILNERSVCRFWPQKENTEGQMVRTPNTHTLPSVFAKRSRNKVRWRVHLMPLDHLLTNRGTGKSMIILPQDRRGPRARPRAGYCATASLMVQ